MPQLILGSEVKGEFPSFVIDIDEIQIKHLTWNDVLEVISMKFKIPTERLYIRTTNGKRVSLKNKDKYEFKPGDYRMKYANSEICNNDYWFTFGISI